MAGPTISEASRQRKVQPRPIGRWNYAEAVTASDSTVFDPPANALLVGTAGTVTVRLSGAPSTGVAIKCIAGQLLPIEVVQVMATGTVSAADMVAFWGEA